MSYSIYIGEATIRHDNSTREKGNVSPQLELYVPAMTHPEAPTFPGDEMTGSGNSRHPGYAQWRTFTRTTGMEALWYQKEHGILASHPGIVLLTAELLAALVATHDTYRRAVPTHRPGICPCAQCNPLAFMQGARRAPAAHDPTLDYHLVRLAWLVWWSEYALTHCRLPAIYNH